MGKLRRKTCLVDFGHYQSLKWKTVNCYIPLNSQSCFTRTVLFQAAGLHASPWATSPPPYLFFASLSVTKYVFNNYHFTNNWYWSLKGRHIAISQPQFSDGQGNLGGIFFGSSVISSSAPQVISPKYRCSFKTVTGYVSASKRLKIQQNPHPLYTAWNER